MRAKIKADKQIAGRMSGIVLMLIVVLTTLMITCSIDVIAIGITPGRTTVDFEPGMKRTIPFSVINNEHKDMKVVFRVEGAFAENIALEQAIVDFSASDDIKEFHYIVELPDKIETPGAHITEIIAMEIPKEVNEKGYYVGATTAVATQFYVRVPYPGKYAEIKLTVVGGKDDEPVNFYVEVLNFGQEDILRAVARVDILGATNEVIASVQTEQKSIASKKRDELTATWVPDVNSGVYHAVAVLEYDGKFARAEKNFNIGDLLLDIIQLEVGGYKNRGDIAVFNMIVESKWNEKVTGAYAQTIINDNEGGEIANFNSAAVDVEPYQQQKMTAYWNTEEYWNRKDSKEGVYDGKIVLHYSGRTTEKKLKTDLKANSLRTTLIGGRAINIGGEGFKVSKLLIFLVVLLVIINAAWFIYFNKRVKKKQG